MESQDFFICKTKIFSGDDLREWDAIRYRGPDDKGSWISESGRVGLHHRRLSIIDLSDSGAQPMVSEDDQHVLIFNGEIYNHLECVGILSSKPSTGEAPQTLKP